MAEEITKFRVKSAVMEDLIDDAIEYEHEKSMCDDYLDTADNFLSGLIAEEYNSLFDIMKFVTFYGTPYEMK